MFPLYETVRKPNLEGCDFQVGLNTGRAPKPIPSAQLAQVDMTQAQDEIVSSKSQLLVLHPAVVLGERFTCAIYGLACLERVW